MSLTKVAKNVNNNYWCCEEENNPSRFSSSNIDVSINDWRRFRIFLADFDLATWTGSQQSKFTLTQAQSQVGIELVQEYCSFEPELFA